MNRVFLHTGSNQGNRLMHLKQALTMLEERAGIVIRVSKIIETTAWGIRDQPDFLNQAIEAETALDPIGLLDVVLGIEHEMGRVRVQKWGQRLIDIDILYYGDLVWESDRLTLPHPHLQDRNFVLVPLMDIAPHFVHPRFKQTTETLLENCKDTLPTRLYG